MSTSQLNTDKILADLKRIVTDSEILLRDSKDAVGEKALEVRERLTEALDSAKDACRRLENRALDGAKVADKTIRAHPYESIGIAFGVGLLLGVLVTKK